MDLARHPREDAGVRMLMVPEALQALLQELAKGKTGDARILDRGSHWVLRAVMRVSQAAGVSVVQAHALR
jgi:hypothetical protein